MSKSRCVLNLLLIGMSVSFVSGTIYGFAKSRMKRSKKYTTQSTNTKEINSNKKNTSSNTNNKFQHVQSRNNLQSYELIPIIDKSSKNTTYNNNLNTKNISNNNKNITATNTSHNIPHSAIKAQQINTFFYQKPNTSISLCWPVKNPNSKTSPLLNFSFDEYIQPTESGILESGKFGMVRNNGTRYHKGLDIKSFVKDKKNIPADEVRAFSSGTVVYINTNTSSSNFGKYIVIDHGLFLTLYAHLSEIYVTIGKVVVAADKIGKIGTTSNTAKIPNSRAHVHFEIDFLCGNELDFGDWYTKNYGSKDKNFHGKYNGLNLFGVDTIKVATNLAKNCGFAHLFDDEPTAVTMFIKTNTIPDFVKKYQSIVCNNFNINNKILGWKIEWTWYGFPKKWEPIYNLTAEEKNITTKIISYSSSLLDIAKRRGTLSNVNNVIKLGSVINDALTKMGMK